MMELQFFNDKQAVSTKRGLTDDGVYVYAASLNELNLTKPPWNP